MTEMASGGIGVRRWATASLWVWVLAMLLAPLVVYAYGGFFTRYIADDFCTAAKVQEVGFWQSQLFWYAQWTGRYGYNGVLAILEMAGPWVVQLLPGLTIAAWTWILAWTYRAGLMMNRREHPLSARFLPLAWSSLTIGATVLLAPNVYQSLYWQTGLVNYALPIVLLTLQAWLVIQGRAADTTRRTRRTMVAVIVGLVALLSAAFSETYLIAQGLLYLVGFAWLGWSGRTMHRPKEWWRAGAGLAGTLIAASVVVVAPGNAIRMSFMPERVGWLDTIFSAARYSAAFVYRTASTHTMALVLLAVVSAAIGARWGLALPKGQPPVGLRWKLIAGAALGGLLIFALMLPSAYAVGAYPVDRALISTTYILVLLVLGGGSLVGRLACASERRTLSIIVRRWVPVILVLSATWWAVAAIRETLPLVRDARDYAAQWDRRRTTVEEARRTGVQAIVLNPLPHIGTLGEVGEDPSDWVNACFASYYGLDEVVAR